MSASVNSGLPLNQCENGVHHVQLLSAKPDKHDGVVVDMKDPVDPDRFHTMLRASLSQWRQQGKKGVWIKLPISLVNLVETAVKEGFIYHHAEPNYLMLVYWIPETASTIPANASHRVGIGAIVLNDKREILVVQEKTGVFKGTGVWKIPTGVVDQEEDIFKAAEREVREETGIDAQFLEVLAFRQLHKSYFGKSDLFFLCMMRPLSYDIQKQEIEIEAAQWMPLEEFAAQPFAQKHDIFKYIIRLCLAKGEPVLLPSSADAICQLHPEGSTLHSASWNVVPSGYICNGGQVIFYAVEDDKDVNLCLQLPQKHDRWYAMRQNIRNREEKDMTELPSYKKVSRDNVFPSPVGCLNCTICQYPCQPLTPPPPPLPDYPVYASPPPPPQLPGYPVYGAQPPPSSIPGYPIYGSPPSSPSQVNCTQFPVQCCQNPPPQPFVYQPYENFSAPCSSLHITSVLALILCNIALLL